MYRTCIRLSRRGWRSRMSRDESVKMVLQLLLLLEVQYGCAAKGYLALRAIVCHRHWYLQVKSPAWYEPSGLTTLDSPRIANNALTLEQCGSTASAQLQDTAMRSLSFYSHSESHTPQVHTTTDFHNSQCGQRFRHGKVKSRSPQLRRRTNSLY